MNSLCGEEQEGPVEGSGCCLLRQQQQGGSAGVCGHKAARDHECIVTPNDHCKLLALNSWQSPCLSLQGLRLQCGGYPHQ